jgi:hypothetical protein
VKLKEALVAANHSLTNLMDPWGSNYNYQASSKVTFYLWSGGGSADRAVWIGNPKP